MKAIKSLLYKMADDALIIGHRNAEWTGLGPTLEEDISFSSIAQDKVGHAFNLYTILNEQCNEADPDTLGFKRKAIDFQSCQLAELPNAEYDQCLIRHFLFDHAEYLRYKALQNSSFEPLANLAKKVAGEIKYHILHADIWIDQLGNGSEESHARLQTAINDLFPYALGIFEESELEKDIISEKIFIGEVALAKKWLEKISPIIEKSNLKLPTGVNPIYGGRNGVHTEHLQPLLDEMTEVTQVDVNAEW